MFIWLCLYWWCRDGCMGKRVDEWVAAWIGGWKICSGVLDEWCLHAYLDDERPS